MSRRRKYRRRWTSAYCIRCKQAWDGLWLDNTERRCIRCGYEFNVTESGGQDVEEA